jgi:FAD synthase
VVIKSDPHKINGKFYGEWLTFPDGRVLYMAHRSGAKSKSIYFAKMAWCLDTATLREAEYRGVTAIGIRHKLNNKLHIYVSNLTDWWGKDSEVHPEGKTPQRRLPLDKFLVKKAKVGKKPMIDLIAAKIAL